MGVSTFAARRESDTERQREGTGRLRNAGVAAATFEIVAFLDDATVAAHDWLAALLAAYADPHVLGVGGRVVPVWRTERPGLFPSEFDGVVGCSNRGMPSSEPWCETSGVQTCRCGVASSSNPAVSMSGSVGLAPDLSVASRPRFAFA